MENNESKDDIHSFPIYGNPDQLSNRKTNVDANFPSLKVFEVDSYQQNPDKFIDKKPLVQDKSLNNLDNPAFAVPSVNVSK